MDGAVRAYLNAPGIKVMIAKKSQSPRKKDGQSNGQKQNFDVFKSLSTTEAVALQDV